MGVMMYKQDESPICIDHTDMAGYESLGWSINENVELPVETEKQAELIDEPETEDQDNAELLALAVAEYRKKFGEKPHHRMKLQTILDKVNGNEPV
jgi:hypothetical protein